MAQIILTWNYTTASVWRIQRTGAQLAAECETEDLKEVLALLKRNSGGYFDNRLRVYLDLPDLDHHVERLPLIESKLQRQLLNQRKIKRYGNGDRAWVAAPMSLGDGGTHEFRLISSMPSEIADTISRWCLAEAMQLEGVFSLPFALTQICGEDQPSAVARVEHLPFHPVGYLVARSASGHLLFFNRLSETYANTERALESARRLSLFVEQEFAETPPLAITDLGEDFDDRACIVFRLARTRADRRLDMVSQSVSGRQRRLRLRLKAFVLLAGVLAVSIWLTLPKYEKIRALELSLDETQVSIVETNAAIDENKSLLLETGLFNDVIEFSRGRERIEDGGPVPAPLPVVLIALANNLPETVELDKLRGQFEIDQNAVHVELRARPLTADLNLTDAIKRLQEQMTSQGWRMSEPEVVFDRSHEARSRFVDARGQIRQFTLRCVIIPQ